MTGGGQDADRTGNPYQKKKIKGKRKQPRKEPGEDRKNREEKKRWKNLSRGVASIQPVGTAWGGQKKQGRGRKIHRPRGTVPEDWKKTLEKKKKAAGDGSET